MKINLYYSQSLKGKARTKQEKERKCIINSLAQQVSPFCKCRLIFMVALSHSSQMRSDREEKSTISMHKRKFDTIRNDIVVHRFQYYAKKYIKLKDKVLKGSLES